MFQISDGLAFVEVKVEAKTSAEQLAKYATFAACQKTEGNVMLILLGKTVRGGGLLFGPCLGEAAVRQKGIV